MATLELPLESVCGLANGARKFNRPASALRWQRSWVPSLLQEADAGRSGVRDHNLQLNPTVRQLRSWILCLKLLSVSPEDS